MRTNFSFAKIRIIYIVTTLFLAGLSLYTFIRIRELSDSLALQDHSHRLTLSVYTPFLIAALFLGALFILLLSYLRIISALKDAQQLQQRLQREKSLGEAILDSSLDLIAVYDTEMRILYYGKTCERLFGKSREEVTGRKLLDVFPQVRNGQSHMDLLRALQGEKIHNEHYFSPAWNRHYENFLTPLRTQDGKIYAVLTIAHDITEHIRNQALLKESYEKFNQLFHLSPFSITLSEIPSGRFVDVNDNYLKTFGFSREEVIGRTTLDLGMTDPEERKKILHEMETSGSVKNVEMELRKKNGEKIPALVSIEKITIGDKIYFLNAVIDIVERKKAEEQIEKTNQKLQEKNKELQSFAYVASHDLQEPLRKIQGFSARILEKESLQLSEKGKDYFHRIGNAARRMQTLIEDLLAYSHTGAEDRTFERMHLGRLVEELREEFKEDLNKKQAVLEIGPMCEADVIPFQFRQMLENLLANALKFSRPDRVPHINIAARTVEGSHADQDALLPQKTYCHLTFADNGIGFEPQYKDRIFGVFQRLHGKDEYKGTGIGLAIVKKIVENHNGVIVANGEPDKGARFDIYFPAL